MQETISDTPPHSLLEALFEVRYATQAAKPLPASDRHKLQAALKERFPDAETGVDNQIGLQVQTQGNQVQTRLTPPGQRHVFRARPPNRLVQLTDAAFTVNILRPYGGWQDFHSSIVREWETAKAALGVRLGPQMVLRFVNRFERTPRSARVRDWLRPGPFVPSGILDAPAGFAVKTQLQSDAETMTTSVTLGTLALPEDSEPAYLPLLLDIEVTFDLVSVLPTQNFTAMLNMMHAAAKEAFFSSIDPSTFARVTKVFS